MKIYSYRKESDAHTTYRAQGDEVQELCTIDGVTYFTGPDVLPPQPVQISVAEVTLTDELREQIKAQSPACKLITARMQEKIKEKYPRTEDELFLARISVGQIMGTYTMTAEEQQEVADYQAHVEAVRDWGRAQRAELGL